MYILLREKGINGSIQLNCMIYRTNLPGKIPPLITKLPNCYNKKKKQLQESHSKPAVTEKILNPRRDSNITAELSVMKSS